MGKKCKEENCDKRAYYNLLNEKSAIYCFEHKKENIIPSLTYVRVHTFRQNLNYKVL